MIRLVRGANRGAGMRALSRLGGQTATVRVAVLRVLAPAAALVALAMAAPAHAASVTSIGKGFPYLLNESDHVVLARLVLEEGEENLTGPWSVWAEGKSTALKPLNGAEKHEEGENPRHELFIGGINGSGDLGGSSTIAFTDEGKERAVLRPVWFGPGGEPHEVAMLQESFTNKKSETFHEGGFGLGIDEAGDVAGTEGYQPESGANVTSRAVLVARGGSAVSVGGAVLPEGGSSEMLFINASGETVGGTTAPAKTEGEEPKTNWYLWPTAGSAGTPLNYDTPASLASDGTTVGERKGKFYIRLPEGTETEIAGLEKPYRVNSSHVVVGETKVSGAEHAAEWREGAVTDLNTQLPKGSGWVLERAVAINDGGDIVGVGSHEGKEEAFLLEAGLRSATVLACAPASEAGVARCTAKVSDASGGEPAKTPTGSVSFTATAGSFAEAKCELKASGTAGLAECAASYKPPSPPSGPVKLTASYAGDSEFAASSGSLTECGNGQDLELESVKWVGRHDHGLEIGHEAIVHGCDIEAGDVLRWGNDLAKETVAASELSPDGTTVTTTIPWSATSGTLSLSDGRTTVNMAEPLEVDSWRNNEGFSFSNYSQRASRNEMVDAFAEPIITPEYTLPPAYERFFLAVVGEEEKAFGRCFGIAALSAQLDDGSVAVGRFGPAATPFGLDRESVRPTIGVDWWKQFADELRTYKAGAPTTAGEIRSQLNAAFGPNGFTHPALLGFDWATTVKDASGTKEVWHGHEITAFGVRDDYPHPGEFTIYTYNSNVPIQPGEDSADGVLHDKAQTASNVVIKENGEWSDPAEHAEGVAERLEIIPVEALEQPLHLALRVGRVTTFLSPGTGVAAVTDPATGKPIDLAAGGSGTVRLHAPIEASAARASSYAGAGVGGVESIEGPAGEWKETLGGTDASPGAEWLGPSAGASLKASGPGFASSDFNSASGALGLSPMAGEPSPAKAGLQLYSAYRGGATEHVLSLSGPLVKAKAKAVFTKGGAVQIATAGAARLHVELSIAGGGVSSQSFDLGTVALPKNGTLTVSVSSWPALAHARVTGTIRAHGRKRRLRFENRLRPPRTRILKRSLSGHVLKLLLALPALSGKGGSAITIEAHATRGRATVGSAKLRLVPGSSRRQSATLDFERALPRGTRVTVTVVTATGGATPSSSKTSASLTAR